MQLLFVGNSKNRVCMKSPHSVQEMTDVTVREIPHIAQQTLSEDAKPA
jgi:hypothetical protein